MNRPEQDLAAEIEAQAHDALAAVPDYLQRPNVSSRPRGDVDVVFVDPAIFMAPASAPPPTVAQLHAMARRAQIHEED